MFDTKDHAAKKKPHAVIEIIGDYGLKVAPAEASSIVKQAIYGSEFFHREIDLHSITWASSINKTRGYSVTL